jgi:hypothetical protein
VSISDLSTLTKLLPYELKTRKYYSLKIFTEIVSMKEQKIHLTDEGKNLILSECKLINAHTPKNNY